MGNETTTTTKQPSEPTTTPTPQASTNGHGKPEWVSTGEAKKLTGWSRRKLQMLVACDEITSRRAHGSAHLEYLRASLSIAMEAAEKRAKAEALAGL